MLRTVALPSLPTTRRDLHEDTEERSRQIGQVFVCRVATLNDELLDESSWPVDCAIYFRVHSLKLTWPLQMDGWNTTFLLGRPIFRGYVSFREGKSKVKTTEVGSCWSQGLHRYRYMCIFWMFPATCLRNLTKKVSAMVKDRLRPK